MAVCSFNEITCNRGNQWTSATCQHEWISEASYWGKKKRDRIKHIKFKKRQNQTINSGERRLEPFIHSGLLRPQGLAAYCFFCLKYSFPREQCHVSFTAIRSLLKHYLICKVFRDQLIKNHAREHGAYTLTHTSKYTHAHTTHWNMSCAYLLPILFDFCSYQHRHIDLLVYCLPSHPQPRGQELILLTAVSLLLKKVTGTYQEFSKNLLDPNGGLRCTLSQPSKF